MRAASLPPNWEDLVKNSLEIATTEEFDLAETWTNEIDSDNLNSPVHSAGPSLTKITDPFAIVPAQSKRDSELSPARANSSSESRKATVQPSEGEKSAQTSSKRLKVTFENDKNAAASLPSTKRTKIE